MIRIRLFLICLILLLSCGLFAANLRADEPPLADNPNDKIEVDARGPVHEAYAQPWQTNPGPNEAVDKKPPEPIPEEPAAEKPKGKNVQWVPGYWQWDVDRKDFIWVSGFWRDVPEGRRWVMGYWTKTDDKYRWVSGHWAAEQEKDNQYVPEPPKNPDQGPTTPAPDADSFYIPGCHFYGDDGYSYRDGYWAGFEPGLMWVPARYIWSPYGYVFASGYWDYGFANRGLLFAPVYFRSPLWLTSGWYYRPSYAIGFGGLYGSLFVGSGWGHYYFGDWYGPGYLGYGIRPWFWHSNRFYDPLWVHARWTNAGNPGWAGGVQGAYIARVNGTTPLPPRTLAGQTSGGTRSPQMVSTLAQVRASGTALQPVTAQQHATSLQTARSMVSQSQQLSQGVSHSLGTGGGMSFNRNATGAFTTSHGSGPITGAPSHNFAPSTSAPSTFAPSHMPSSPSMGRPSMPASGYGGGGHSGGGSRPSHK